MKTELSFTVNPQSLISDWRERKRYRPTVVLCIINPNIPTGHVLLVEHENGGPLACPQGEIPANLSIEEASYSLAKTELGLERNEVSLSNVGHRYPHFCYTMEDRIPSGYRKGKGLIFNFMTTSRTKFIDYGFPEVINPIIRASWVCVKERVFTNSLCGMKEPKRSWYIEAINCLIDRHHAAIRRAA